MDWSAFYYDDQVLEIINLERGHRFVLTHMPEVLCS